MRWLNFYQIITFGMTARQRKTILSLSCKVETMEFRKSLRYSFLSECIPIVLLLLLCGCSFDAERDNPLDPQSNNYRPEASLYGRITMLDGNTPIVGALVSLSPDSIIIYSGDDGFYRFDCLEGGNYTLSLQHQDFASNFHLLRIYHAQDHLRNFTMNALPRFDSLSVATQRFLINSLAHFYFKLEVFASISDPDGITDLSDSATVFWHDSASAILSKESGTSNYVAILDSNYFPGNKVENMLGVQMRVEVEDINGAKMQSQPIQLVRLINSYIRPFSPGGTASGNPTFLWSRAQDPPLGFDDYFYRLLVFRTTEPEQTRYETIVFNQIDNNIIYLLEDDTLQTGGYFWQVQVEDFFGDFSRCESMYFNVQ